MTHIISEGDECLSSYFSGISPLPVCLTCTCHFPRRDRVFGIKPNGIYKARTVAFISWYFYRVSFINYIEKDTEKTRDAVCLISPRHCNKLIPEQEPDSERRSRKSPLS